MPVAGGARNFKEPQFIPRMNFKSDLPNELREAGSSDLSFSPSSQPQSSRRQSSENSSSHQLAQDDQPHQPDVPNDPIENDPHRPATPLPDSEPLTDDQESDNDLPRMPDTSSSEDSDDDEDNIEPIPNLNSRPSYEIQSSTRGRPVRAQSNFMKGKYIRLDMTDGQEDSCALCNHYAPLAANLSEVLSFDLEKILWRNGIYDHRGDGFGISFVRSGGLNSWQIVCKQCLDPDSDQQNVIDDVFRIRFHQQNGNLNKNQELNNVFSDSEYLTVEVIKDIRKILLNY